MSDKPSTTLDLRRLTGYALVQVHLVALDPQASELDRRRIIEPVAIESNARDWPDGWWEDPSILTAAQMRECRAPAAPEERLSES